MTLFQNGNGHLTVTGLSLAQLLSGPRQLSLSRNISAPQGGKQEKDRSTMDLWESQHSIKIDLKQKTKQKMDFEVTPFSGMCPKNEDESLIKWMCKEVTAVTSVLIYSDQ